MNKKYDRVFIKAIHTWGGEAQETVAVEECADFIKMSCKLRRSDENLGDLEFNNLIDKIADVTIMMRQMAIIAGGDRVKERIAYKVDRLSERLGLTQELRK